MNALKFGFVALALGLVALGPGSALANPAALPRSQQTPKAPTALTFTVNSLVDEPDANPGNGVCKSTPSKVCTVRAAIMENNALGGGNIISVPAGIYTLQVSGDLETSGNLTLRGAGANLTRLSVTNQCERVLHTLNGRVKILDLALSSGCTSGYGGGILVESPANVKLIRVTVFNNFSDAAGGGIMNWGTLMLKQTTVGPNNSAHFAGNGIDSVGTLTLRQSRITGNQPAETQFTAGGGLYNAGTATIVDSAIDQNFSATGGGIQSSGDVKLVNTTISGNKADSGSSSGSEGGGIVNGGSMNLYNVTLADNQSGLNAKTGGLYNGGGANAYNSILDRNRVLANQNLQTYFLADCYGPLSGVLNVKFYILIYAPVGCYYGPDPSVQTNVHANLGPLQNNGGFTPTQALKAGSPAIDKANPKGCVDQNGNILTTDQRGALRPTDGDGNGKARCDLGAYEY